MSGIGGAGARGPATDIGAIDAAGGGRALAALAVPPADIERLSIERLRALATATLPEPPADAVALRMAYATGDPALLADIEVDPAAVAAITRALAAGAPVVCDVGMVASGVRSSVAPLGCAVLCAVDAAGEEIPAVVSAATRRAAAGSTRTARGLLALADRLGGAVVAIGNAPTAVLALLDALGDGAAPPVAVVATCCGQVAAAEAKALLRAAGGLPVISVRGTRGGSAVAAAAVNACARLASGGGPGAAR